MKQRICMNSLRTLGIRSSISEATATRWWITKMPCKYSLDNYATKTWPDALLANLFSSGDTIYFCLALVKESRKLHMRLRLFLARKSPSTIRENREISNFQYLRIYSMRVFSKKYFEIKMHFLYVNVEHMKSEQISSECCIFLNKSIKHTIYITLFL